MLEGDLDTAKQTKPNTTLSPQGTQEVDKVESLNEEMNPLDRRYSHDGVTFNSREQLQLNELREARIRAVQMEKTMRWWSDCTANWRDKWGQVKNERNKAREDNKVLKQKLDDANHEIYKLKRERNEFKEGNNQLRKDVEKMAAELKRDRRAFVQPMRFTDGSSAQIVNTANLVRSQPDMTKASKFDQGSQPLKDMPALINDAEAFFVEITKAHEGDKTLEEQQSFSVREQSSTLNDGVKQTKDEDGPENELKKELDNLVEKLKDTESKMAEESRLKETLSKTIDVQKAEIENLKGSLQEQTNAKENAINELTRLKEDKDKENETKNTSNIRVAYSTESVDRKVKDLRLEIERLQKDNAAEWNKREKLETQKLNAERENKKLRHQIADLGNELKAKVNEVNQAADYKLKQVQNELDEKKKELADLKVSHMKLKRIYQDKKEDILHNKTRVDHHEDEIKKLRARIDELKMKLTAAEDEVDQKENLARKLQRSLDDQTQQCQVLRVQMEHLQSRWKKMTISTRAPKRGERNSCTDDESLLEIDL